MNTYLLYAANEHIFVVCCESSTQTQRREKMAHLRVLGVAACVALAGGGGSVGCGWSVGSVCRVCSVSVGGRGRQVHVEGLQAVHLSEDLLLGQVESQGIVFVLRVGVQEPDVETGEEQVVLGGACAPVVEAGDGRAWNVHEQFCYGRIVRIPELRGGPPQLRGDRRLLTRPDALIV